MTEARIYLTQPDSNDWIPMVETPYAQEVDLQKALVDYPDLIPGDQINPDNPRRWLLVKDELGIPEEEGGGTIWWLDHLFIDQDSIPTFIECKRAVDTRSRREVVAQMLDYAASSTEYWPVDRLRQAAAETARKQGRNLDDQILQLIERDEPADVEAYWEAVEENLRNGRFPLPIRYFSIRCCLTPPAPATTPPAAASDIPAPIPKTAPAATPPPPSPATSPPSFPFLANSQTQSPRQSTMSAVPSS